MSADEENTTPVTTGEMTPLTTGMTAIPSEEGAGGTKQFPIPFGGAEAKVTTQLKGPTWKQFRVVTQETLTAGTHWENHYDASSGLGYIPEGTGAEAGHESRDTDTFVDTRLGLLERRQDCLAQMIKASLKGLPRLVAKVVQQELQARPVVPPVVQPVVPPLGPQWVVPQPQVLDGRAPDLAPRQDHLPTELLDATFDGTPEKLAFFV
ncbi:UNVERIFIED_CONTAM: hypothetical protein K2H54_057364, partial [Gekko kuhli]